jgi:hypothetical protein
MARERRTPIQRTLILTLGEEGSATGQHLQQMLEEWGAPPVVAVRHLDSGGELPEEVTIDEALHEISRLAHRIRLDELGYSTDRLDELVVWAVGPPDAPLNAVAGLAAGRAAALLGLDPFTLGLALWRSRPSMSGDPGPSDQNPDTISLPSSPAHLSTSSLRPLYLSGMINEAGLTLDDDEALYRRAARFLLLHTCTGLRDTPVWVEQASGWGASGWGDGGWGTSKGFASFGLAWLAWPGDVAQARAAGWIAEAAARQVMGDTGGAMEAEALLREAALAPSLLAPRLTPPSVAKAVRLAAGDASSLAPWALWRPSDGPEHPLLANLEAVVSERESVLELNAPAWERAMETGIRTGIAQVRDWVSRALDAGGLCGARGLGEALAKRLGEWAGGAEQRLEEAREDLARIEQEGQAVHAKLASLLAQVGRCRVRDLLLLLRNPLRWIWLWSCWREAQRLYTRYMLFQAAALETRVLIEQMKRACGVYWAACAELESVSRELDRLEHGVCHLLDTPSEPPDWPSMPLLLADDPDALLARLMEQHLPDLQSQARDLLDRWGPLSQWWTEGLPYQVDVERWLMAQAEPLANVSIGEIVRLRYPERQALQGWMDELVAQASPTWRWDPAALSEDERGRLGNATVLLSALDGGVPWDEDATGVRTLLLDRADRLAVVILRWGIGGQPPEATT